MAALCFASFSFVQIPAVADDVTEDFREDVVAQEESPDDVAKEQVPDDIFDTFDVYMHWVNLLAFF